MVIISHRNLAEEPHAQIQVGVVQMEELDQEIQLEAHQEQLCRTLVAAHQQEENQIHLAVVLQHQRLALQVQQVNLSRQVC